MLVVMDGIKTKPTSGKSVSVLPSGFTLREMGLSDCPLVRFIHLLYNSKLETQTEIKHNARFPLPEIP